MFAGRDEVEEEHDEIIYIAINTFWETQTFTMPDISSKYKWQIVINTMEEEGYIEDRRQTITGNSTSIGPRTVMVFKNTAKSKGRGRKKTTN